MPGRKRPRELNSWKEIAAFLDVSVRTAQTWESQKGLPVHRMRAGRGRVSARTDEIEVWKAVALRGHPWWMKPRILYTYAAMATVLLLAAVGHELFIHSATARKGPPARFEISGRSLIVTDAKGIELWHRDFPEGLQPGSGHLPSSRTVLFVDLDGKGGLETLLAHNPAVSSPTSSALICFSEDGNEGWRYLPGVSLEDSSKKGHPPHRISDLLVMSLAANAPVKILVLVKPWDESFTRIAVLDASGDLLAEHSYEGAYGFFETGDADGCGTKEVLLGGADAREHQASLLLLRLAETSLRNVGRPADRPETTEGAALETKASVLFPRTCVNLKLEQHNTVSKLSTTDTCTQVFVTEREDPPAEVAYCLGSDLAATGVWFSDSLVELHHQLQLEGVLGHALTQKEIAGMGFLVRRGLDGDE